MGFEFPRPSCFGLLVGTLRAREGFLNTKWPVGIWFFVDLDALYRMMTLRWVTGKHANFNPKAKLNGSQIALKFFFINVLRLRIRFYTHKLEARLYYYSISGRFMTTSNRVFNYSWNSSRYERSHKRNHKTTILLRRRETQDQNNSGLQPINNIIHMSKKISEYRFSTILVSKKLKKSKGEQRLINFNLLHMLGNLTRTLLYFKVFCRKSRWI